MKVTIWGTRGSFPVAKKEMLTYGGNTTCVEVRTDAGDIIILDAGMGIQELSKKLCVSQNGGECTICFTHKHWDHVHGITSFRPFYYPGWNISMFGPQYGETAWEQTLETLFDGSHFPLTWENIGKTSTIKEFSAGDSFTIGSAYIETCATCHPGGCVAYKITADGWTFLFSGDHEWQNADFAEQKALENFLVGADVVLADAQFKSEDYSKYKGYGHSTMEHWIEHALKTDVKCLVFTHYHPDYTDIDLEKNLNAIYQAQSDLPLQLMLAREGMCIHGKMHSDELKNVPRDPSCTLCQFSQKVSRYTDPCLVLESVLTEARKLGEADAGTIYLINQNKQLGFVYAQNTTIFPGSAANRMTYLDSTLPMDKNSIAGYVALSATILNIPDVRCLPDDAPYTFNDSFDVTTGYHTVSMLTVPLIDSATEVVGVLQLINHLVEGKAQSFPLHLQEKIAQLSITAAHSIERSRLSDSLVLRMLETAALRDPTETAGHVMRVGTMVAEIYHRWAEKRNIPDQEIRGTRDTIRLAAMLHDVGKVGIPDAILKKPAKLTDEEFVVIQGHCAIGAALFKNPTSQLDIMAYNIALHHHQKWNGKGYTGDPEKPCLSGLDIPVEARITAVADVYDALISRRCYKEAITPEEAKAILQKDAGTHFDPEVIEAFLEITDTIDAIHERFIG